MKSVLTLKASGRVPSLGKIYLLFLLILIYSAIRSDSELHSI